jgi:chromosome segregation ATPase
MKNVKNNINIMRKKIRNKCRIIEELKNNINQLEHANIILKYDIHELQNKIFELTNKIKSKYDQKESLYKNIEQYKKIHNEVNKINEHFVIETTKLNKKIKELKHSENHNDINECTKELETLNDTRKHQLKYVQYELEIEINKYNEEIKPKSKHITLIEEILREQIIWLANELDKIQQLNDNTLHKLDETNEHKINEECLYEKNHHNVNIINEHVECNINETIKGDETLKCEETVKGDEIIKCDETVKGNETLKCEETIKGDETVKGVIADVISDSNNNELKLNTIKYNVLLKHNLSLIAKIQPNQKLWLEDGKLEYNQSYWITRKFYSQNRASIIEFIENQVNSALSLIIAVNKNQESSRLIESDILVKDLYEIMHTVAIGLVNMKTIYYDQSDTIQNIINNISTSIIVSK